MRENAEKCRHINYDDIVRFFHTEVNDFFYEDEMFLNSFDERTDKCPTHRTEP